MILSIREGQEGRGTYNSRHSCGGYRHSQRLMALRASKKTIFLKDYLRNKNKKGEARAVHATRVAGIGARNTAGAQSFSDGTRFVRTCKNHSCVHALACQSVCLLRLVSTYVHGHVHFMACVRRKHAFTCCCTDACLVRVRAALMHVLLHLIGSMLAIHTSIEGRGTGMAAGGLRRRAYAAAVRLPAICCTCCASICHRVLSLSFSLSFIRTPYIATPLPPLSKPIFVLHNV